MKKILIATMIAAFAMPVFAEQSAETYKKAHEQIAAEANSNSLSYVDNRSFTPAETTANINYNQSGTATLKTVPAVMAPALVSSNDTCMGSTSFGASGVGFGISIGSSWTDANCVMLKNAREMFNMGMPDVAFARLCMDDLNKESIEMAGRVCPPRKAKDAK